MGLDDRRVHGASRLGAGHVHMDDFAGVWRQRPIGGHAFDGGGHAGVGVLATAFCVNLRFAVFSLHLRGYLMAWPRWQRLTIGYLIADLNYVQFVQNHPAPATEAAGQRAEMAYLCGNCFLTWAGWQIASILGIVLASQVPLEWGLGFAGVLALIGILCSLASSRMRTVSLVVSGAAAVAAYALPLRLNILVAIAAAVAMCLIIEKTAGVNKAAT